MGSKQEKSFKVMTKAEILKQIALLEVAIEWHKAKLPELKNERMAFLRKLWAIEDEEIRDLTAPPAFAAKSVRLHYLLHTYFTEKYGKKHNKTALDILDIDEREFLNLRNCGIKTLAELHTLKDKITQKVEEEKMVTLDM